MIETCSDSMACRYDFIVTLDKEFARLTKEEETEAANMAKTAQTEGLFAKLFSFLRVLN